MSVRVGVSVRVRARARARARARVRANPNPNQVHVSNATIAEWQQKYDAVMRALSDDEEEADMERLNAQARP